MPSSTALVWFRRDLRVHDHPALRAALAGHDRVVPVFCFDDRLLHGRHASGPRTQFLLESLEDLASSLRDRGAELVIRNGPPERELVELARATGAGHVHYSRDLSPFARTRGERVGAALGEAGIAEHAHPGLTIADWVGDVRTQAGTPYTVFSPFHRNWLEAPRRDVIGAPRSIAFPANLAPGQLPSLEHLGLEQEVSEPMRGGEGEGRRRMRAFLRAPVKGYAEDHDALGRDRTSRLSPYLHFGCVSPRELEDALGPTAAEQAFRRQLCWRDFYHHVLLEFPRNAHEEFQERYRGMLEWTGDEQAFEAWREGMTGFPLVDAGMRQLRAEGWMHNRARLVVGSFLTKDLGLDWRLGERWFMRLLIDGDEANNNGNWQWIASVGVDPQPFFRRIYNPARQQKRFDPEGAYVQRWVPELGTSAYPEPVVDHAVARQLAMQRYRSAARG